MSPTSFLLIVMRHQHSEEGMGEEKGISKHFLADGNFFGGGGGGESDGRRKGTTIIGDINS